jgi:hypothetical protein
VTVELHCEVAPWYFSFALATEGLIARARRTRLQSANVLTLSPEDLLLFLTMHGTKHCWQHLELISALAELIRNPGDLDWDAAVARGRSVGGVRMLLLGALLAQQLFEVPLPASLRIALEHDTVAHGIAVVVIERLREPSDNLQSLARLPWLHLRARERRVDRLRYCLRGLVGPELDDAAAVFLPRPLFPLYWAIRPVRVLGLYARAALSL